MQLIMSNYSGVKYRITTAIRYIELISSSKQSYDNVFKSELIYWLNLLNEIRFYLASIEDESIDDTIMPVKDILSEICSDINNMYILLNSQMSNRHKELLALAWANCKEALKIL